MNLSTNYITGFIKILCVVIHSLWENYNIEPKYDLSLKQTRKKSNSTRQQKWSLLPSLPTLDSELLNDTPHLLLDSPKQNRYRLPIPLLGEPLPTGWDTLAERTVIAAAGLERTLIPKGICTTQLPQPQICRCTWKRTPARAWAPGTEETEQEESHQPQALSVFPGTPASQPHPK